jgi:hypothetical protein
VLVLCVILVHLGLGILRDCCLICCSSIIVVSLARRRVLKSM